MWIVRTVVIGGASSLSFLLIDRARRRAALQFNLPRLLGRHFWRFALLNWVSGLVALLVFSRSEIFLLRVFNKPEALGLFALAFGLSQQITAPADAMLHPLIPAVAGVLSAWPERALQTFIRSTRVTSLICGGVAAVVVPALVMAIPLIYGSEFRPVAWLFIPLALVSVFQSVNNPVLAFVNGRERGGLILRAYAAALLVDAGIAVALIPRFGAWAAVAANVVGQLAGILWLAVAEPLARRLGPKGLLRLYVPFILGITTGGVALSVGIMLQEVSAAVALFVVMTLGSAAYITSVRLSSSGLTVQDRDALLGALALRARPYVARLLHPVTTPDAP